MKLKSLPVGAYAALVFTTLVALPVFAQAQTFQNFAPGGFTTTNVCAHSASPPAGCLVLTNGSPANPQVVTGGILRLTTANTNQHGSAWYFTQQPLSTGFTTAFEFQITNNGTQPGDGLAFVIQGDPAGAGAIGFAFNGQNISYGNGDQTTTTGPDWAILNSLAIELDTYQNSDFGDPDGNHIAIQSCGPNNSSTLSANSADHNYICPSGQSAKLGLASLPSGSSLSDGKVHTITVNYNPPGGCMSNCNNLTVFFDSISIVSATVDLTQQLFLTSTASNNNQPATGAYVGFTAATGAAVEKNDILSWSFSQLPLSPITIPEPLQATVTTFNYSATLNSTTDYSQSGLPASSFTGVTMDGTVQAITDAQFATLVQNTPFQGATCLHQDLGGTLACVVTTDLCTTSSNNTPAGANCPNTGTNALIGTSNTFNGDVSQKPFVNPGYLMGKDNALTACQATDNNTCKGLQNIFSSIQGDATTMKGRTNDFNSLLIPVDGIVSPSTAATTSPALHGVWTNGPVTVTLNSTEVVPANNTSAPATLPNITGISYTISGANAQPPVNGNITGAKGSFNVPGSVEGTTTVTFQASDDAGTLETITTTTGNQVSTSLPTLTIQVDLTNPTAQCTPGGVAWQAADVMVPCVASDNPGGSGLATPANFNVSTAVPMGTETNAAFTVAQNVSDIAGNTISTGTFGPFEVDKKAPMITGPSVPSPLVYGQQAQISWSCTDGGSGVVRCGPQGSAAFPATASTGTLMGAADTTSAGAKTFTIYATDAVGNAAAPSGVNYVVGQATPVLTWPTPAPMAYGTPLTGTQLNATANVPGTFVYNPPAGTILPAGMQALRVTFTPNDTVNYKGASAQVMVTVTQPTLTISPTSVNFGNVPLRNTVSQIISLSNPGPTPIPISNIKIVPIKGDSDDFFFTSNCPSTLPGQGACAVGVAFVADELGLRTANLVLTDGAAGSPQLIPVSANVVKK
jgi:hypothetical protein